MFNTNFCFTPGKLTTSLDGQAGSSGKGKLGSFICTHADNWQFACTTAAPQAGHWVRLDDGRGYFYQTLNSCSYLTDRYEKLYIGPGATIELPALIREIEENNIPTKKLGISPIAAILQDIDSGFEKGTHDFEGNDLRHLVGRGDKGGYLAKTGTTAHGAGACRARRVLRRPEAKYARDIEMLKDYICDVPGEIMQRLDAGQSGLLEIAQGFQLSYLLPEFFPFTTSRSCSVAAGLDDMMVPPYYAGNVILNLRTYPIRINSNKYLDRRTGAHLTWEDVKARAWASAETARIIRETGGRNKTVNDFFAEHKHALSKGYLDSCGVTVVEGNSGPGYDDQEELTWEKLTAMSGASEPIMEMTSVTKLPRRVFTFSKKNLQQAVRHNRTGGDLFLSVNFANYCDADITGKRGVLGRGISNLGNKMESWLLANIPPTAPLRFVGTGARTDDMIMIQEHTDQRRTWS